MKAGIRSIGWWVPEARLDAQEIAQAYGLPAGAVAGAGLHSRAVAGPDDHPSTMAARATRHALGAAGLALDDLDLLIFAGVTRDWPNPWVAAFGVLHELGAPGCAGFDIANRCAAGIDALWIAKALVESGTHKTVAVCCADRFDHYLGPQDRPARTPFDTMYSAGAATAIVSAEADNTMAGYAHYTNPRLAVHCATGPWSGGSRAPLDRRGLEAGHHLWQVRMSVRDLDDISRYEVEADRHNYPSIMKQAGVDGFDLVACSPLDPGPQLKALQDLGIDPAATLFTVPRLGHIGPADLFLILGIAVASGRAVGNRVAMSMRTSAYANALALIGAGSDPGIRVAGQGVDLRLWQAAPSPERLAEEHTP
ncbi:hypothetical protein [Piscinibacter sp.]|uniref:hypothetical protein n=1 Tax=Piscinibacter sp. TaxID=1903157 RepID=UPI002C9CDCD2|nr:hypothetical protein [Albitalea sp.]HUG23690.1 hypothetical protein [Albitalea sp.]